MNFPQSRFRRLSWALLLLWLAPLLGQAQSKPVTLEDIWALGRFYAQSAGDLDWMPDDRFYTDLVPDVGVVQFAVATGAPVDTLVPASAMRAEGRPLNVTGYVIGGDGSTVLLHTDTRAIYRHSRAHVCYVWNGRTQQLQPVYEGKHLREPALSPDGSKLGFVFENNLYYVDLASGSATQVTDDGKYNEIINGHTDWVYEEEFGFPEAFYWSPDSKRIAYYRFDERAVPLYTMDMYGTLYPKRHEFKYPKAGEANSVVSIHVYELGSRAKQTVDVGSETDQYIPRIRWTQNPAQLALLRLNRHQNRAELLLAEAATGNTRVVMTETTDTWLDVEDETLTFLPDGKHFLWKSDRDGYNHLYLYELGGKLVRQVTKGNWEVTAFYGFNPKTNTLYYQSTEDGSTQRTVYAIGLDGKRKTRLSPAEGVNSANFSSSANYFILRSSTAEMPTLTALYGADGKRLKVFEDNARLRRTVVEYRISPMRFFTHRTANGDFNAWMIRPTDFDSTKRYPLLMFVYGGPGSQEVLNEWDGLNRFWYQLLADKGYVIACVDGRGTGGRGAAFLKATYQDLGRLETADQIASAKAFGELGYIDAERIGIWGWSYGGYMTLLAMTKGADVFKTGIAVAPVTNWRFYDTIYTERFLRTPQENPKGYDENSPINFANQLKGKLLLVHGTGDDNVHYQNSLEMTNALVRANKQFLTFYYPNRNHGIYGGNTRLHLYRMMTDFVLANL